MIGTSSMIDNVYFFLPAFALAILQLLIALYLFIIRVVAVSRKEIPLKYFALKTGANPPDYLSRGDRNYINLFETPILFYAALLFALFFALTEPMLYWLAWLYCALRYVHTIIHVSYNRVIHRLTVFILSVIVLAVIWMHIFGQLFLR